MSGLRTAIVAHGRFHAFDLARELQTQGHDVTVLSNYPSWVVARFGVDPRRYRGLPMHGAIERVLRQRAGILARSESWRHQWFGRWASRVLEDCRWDIVHCWSGVSEELLRSPKVHATRRILMRGSAHILDQSVLLRDEEIRTGVPVDRPSSWMIEREQREYDSADRVLVLSEFARASFDRHGYGAGKVDVLPLGVDVEKFRPSAAHVKARARRIREGQPLTVLYVGALSARKGLRDLVATSRLCAAVPMRFVLVGPRLAETSTLLADAGSNVAVLGSRPQDELPDLYWNADLFMFPTIEDGFGMVLTQARAAGLPVLCTPNCAGPDFLTVGRDGWVLPVRAPEAFADRLAWCHDHREALGDMVESIDLTTKPRDWAAVAEQFAQQSRKWVDDSDERRVGA